MCTSQQNNGLEPEKKPFNNWSTIQDLQGLHLVKGKHHEVEKRSEHILANCQNRLREGGVLGGWEFPSLKCASTIALELAGNLIVGYFFFNKCG